MEASTNHVRTELASVTSLPHKPGNLLGNKLKRSKILVIDLVLWGPFTLDISRPAVAEATMALLTLAIVVVAFVLCYFASVVLKPSLIRIPGPWLAKFSNLYRLRLNQRGRFSHDLLDLHRKYGEYVRIGPNVVSISDKRVVGSIYGRGAANFPKVSAHPRLTARDPILGLKITVSSSLTQEI